MKWAILFGGLVLALVVGRLLRKREATHAWIVGALGFLPFVALRRTSISVTFVDYARGDSMGLEITVVDFVALVALAAMARRHAPIPYRVVAPLYLLTVVTSMLFAPWPLVGWFSIWKLARFLLLMTALAWAFEDPRRPPAWLKGVCLGLALQFVQAFQQRFVEGLDQAVGTFPHQNSMGMAIDLIVPIVLAIALAGQGGLAAWTTLALGAACVVLALSRGALVMMGIAVIAVYVMSSTRRFTLKKNLIALGGLLAAGILLAVSFESIVHRFETAPVESEVGRELYVEEARIILADHPFGVGINQWSYVSSRQRYGERAGLEPQDRGGLAHNIYWLTLAELGYHGFVAFILLIAAPFRWALPSVWRHRADIRGDVLLGAIVALAVTHAHGTLEWAWRQTQVGYVYFSVTALVWALARQLSGPRRPARASSRTDR